MRLRVCWRAETHPETGTTSYTYTPDGYTNDLLTSKTDAKGQVTKYTYDGYYRITAINHYTSATNFTNNVDDPCQLVRYVYYSYRDSNFTAQNAWGHVAAVSTSPQDGSGAPTCTEVAASLNAGPQLHQQFSQFYSYAYCSGRMNQKRLQLYEEDGGTLNGRFVSWWDVGYTYDQFGNATTMTYPASQATPTGPVLNIGYDAVRRPSTLSIASGGSGFPMVTSVTYNAANQPTQTAFTNGTGISAFTEYRTYNSMNQLTALSSFNNVNLNLSYTYPAGQNNGQISGMTDIALGQTASYQYDSLKRLTSAAGTGQNAWNQTYSYDGFGNLEAKNGGGAVFDYRGTGNGYSIDATTNRLTGGSYCYDPNGNLTSDVNGGGCRNPNYVYDISNRMVTANLPSNGMETYQYGADNKRLSKITFSSSNGGVTYSYQQTVYIYGAMGEKLTVATGFVRIAGIVGQ